MSQVLGMYLPDPYIKLCLLSLANHCNHETGRCDPGLGLIAKEASCDRRTALRRLKQMEASGLIAIDRRVQGAQRLNNSYRLLFLPVQGSVQQTPPPSVSQTPPRQGGSVSLDTRGSDSAVTLNNRNRTLEDARARAREDDAQRTARMALGSPIPEAVLAWLRKKLGNEAVASWFSDVVVTDVARGEVTLSTSTRSKASRLNSIYDVDLVNAWRTVAPAVHRVVAVAGTTAK